ncbi:MAG: tRNA uridine-5-carboxymethylaminomethyl(34) synthesis GTPase MnmE, partial [Bdellovibrionales bacterium]
MSVSGDTIFALASAQGHGGVAVVRVSGPAAMAGFRALSAAELEPRVARFVHLRAPVSRETIDRALVLYFAAPA